MRLSEIKASAPKPPTLNQLFKADHLNGEQSKGFVLDLQQEVMGFIRDKDWKLKTIHPIKLKPGLYQKAAMYIQALIPNVDHDLSDDLFHMEIASDAAAKHIEDPKRLFMGMHPMGGSRSTSEAVFISLHNLVTHSVVETLKSKVVAKPTEDATAKLVPIAKKMLEAGPKQHSSYAGQHENYAKQWKQPADEAHKTATSMVLYYVEEDLIKELLVLMGETRPIGDLMTGQVMWYRKTVDNIIRGQLYHNPTLQKIWFKKVLKP